MKRDAIAILVGYIAILALYYGGKAALMFLPFRLIPLLLNEIGIQPDSIVTSIFIGFLLIFIGGYLSSLISLRTRFSIIPIFVLLLSFTYPLAELYLASKTHDSSGFTDFSDDWISPTPRIITESVLVLLIGIPAFNLGRKLSARFIRENTDRENLLRIT